MGKKTPHLKSHRGGQGNYGLYSRIVPVLHDHMDYSNYNNQKWGLETTTWLLYYVGSMINFDCQKKSGMGFFSVLKVTRRVLVLSVSTWSLVTHLGKKLFICFILKTSFYDFEISNKKGLCLTNMSTKLYLKKNQYFIVKTLW